MIDDLESTVTAMLSGQRPLAAPTFSDAVVNAELAPAKAIILAGHDHSTPCLAFIRLPQSDDRKAQRLHRWTTLLPGQLVMFAGHVHNNKNLVRFHVRSAVDGRLVIVTADFSQRDEPAAIAAINTGIDCLAPTALTANLAGLERYGPPNDCPSGATWKRP